MEWRSFFVIGSTFCAPAHHQDHNTSLILFRKKPHLSSLLQSTGGALPFPSLAGMGTALGPIPLLSPYIWGGGNPFHLASAGNRRGVKCWKYDQLWMDDLAGLTHSNPLAEWMGGLLDWDWKGKIWYWVPSLHMVPPHSALGKTTFSRQFVIFFFFWALLSIWLQSKCACTERILFLYNLPLLGSLEMLESTHVPNIPVSPKEAVQPPGHYSKDALTDHE